MSEASTRSCYAWDLFQHRLWFFRQSASLCHSASMVIKILNFKIFPSVETGTGGKTGSVPWYNSRKVMGSYCCVCSYMLVWSPKLSTSPPGTMKVLTVPPLRSDSLGSRRTRERWWELMVYAKAFLLRHSNPFLPLELCKNIPLFFYAHHFWDTTGSRKSAPP